MDNHDKRLLKLLQMDNRLTSAQLAEEVGLSVSAVSERVRRLNTAGIIKSNCAVLDPHAIDLGLCAFMFVDLESGAEDELFVSEINSIPEILEAHHITGKHSWLIKVRVKNTTALQALLTHKIKTIVGVQATESIIILETAKETTSLPLHTLDSESDP